MKYIEKAYHMPWDPASDLGFDQIRRHKSDDAVKGGKDEVEMDNENSKA